MEYKFRAYDKKYKKMYYGDVKMAFALPVDEVVVMAGIDIVDANGKDVYHGDICRFHHFTQVFGENLGVSEGENEFDCIVRHDMTYGTSLQINHEDGVLLASVGGLHEESFTVIGNIYENEEMAKEIEDKGRIPAPQSPQRTTTAV